MSHKFNFVSFNKFNPIPIIIKPPKPEIFAYISAVIKGSAHIAAKVKAH